MITKDFTLFYFDSMDRTIVQEPHDFYVKEAKQRLLSQFSDIDDEADRKADQYLEKAGKNFDPDRDDPADAYENAYQEGISHMIALQDMQKTVILALTAGMYHQFDKALREKAIREFSHWLDSEVIASMLWDTGFPRLIELLEWVGMGIREKAFYAKLDACRLVVNVYKHGDGNAHRELSSKYPEYYHQFNFGQNFSLSPDYEHLEITETQFTEFADAITAFWDNIPQYCMRSQLRAEPKWLSIEFEKHKTRVQKRKSGNL